MYGDFLVQISYIIAITDIFYQVRGFWGADSEFPFASNRMLGTSSSYRQLSSEQSMLLKCTIPILKTEHFW